MLRKTLMAGTAVLFPVLAYATPSTTYWAPSTSACQAFATPHVTYDTYYAKDAGYPVDTGLTTGFLPFEKLQGEAGFDVLYPSSDPLYLNGKLCVPEDAMFGAAPGLSAGIYDVGFKKNVNDYDVLYAMLQKTIPGIGGYVAAGVYHGLSRGLFTNSEGNVVQTGFLGAVSSPDIRIGLKGLQKIVFVADVQTGKNVLGAWGFGPYLYFNDYIDLLAGPVFFRDPKAQPGGKGFLWTTQVDVDIPLGKAER